jgi:NADH-quinone oxidoreductase subunit C
MTNDEKQHVKNEDVTAAKDAPEEKAVSEEKAGPEEKAVPEEKAGAQEKTESGEKAESQEKDASKEKEVAKEKDKAEEKAEKDAVEGEKKAKKAPAAKASDEAGKTEAEASDPPKVAKKSGDGDDAAKEAAREKAQAARAARAKAAAARKKADEEDDKPKPPSPNQPKLDRIVEMIRRRVAEDAIEEAYINEADRHLPCVVIRPSHWLQVAQLLRDEEELKLDYLRNIAGVDHETHMEVVYHFMSFKTRDEYCFKVRTDRDQPSVPSVTSIWNTANWNEREIYDLFGIDFPGHPDLRRIMLPDDWVGHPLRKDYEPYDPEV